MRRGRVDVGVVQYVGELDGLAFEPVLASPRVAVVPATSALADADVLTIRELDGCRWLNVASSEPSFREWLVLALDIASPAVRHPAAIPTAVATTGRISLHAAAAARFYPRPDVRFVPVVEGPESEIAICTRTEDERLRKATVKSPLVTSPRSRGVGHGCQRRDGDGSGSTPWIEAAILGVLAGGVVVTGRSSGIAITVGHEWLAPGCRGRG